MTKKVTSLDIDVAKAISALKDDHAIDPKGRGTGYNRHVFICGHGRPEGQRPSCERGGLELLSNVNCRQRRRIIQHPNSEVRCLVL